ncbi:serine hydrolase domain-containing protein [Spirilliplanes yamanashiensis]|uniref:Serine hydrolase n=1 Tax=Spirilliplanes yamanashiensis TaxID=42233 RepID=A0A8J4DJI9_9ACTN|nr:serine hydrolase domain-containing protein [Spirilliplanes yamanashiensis]MDP9817303.1 D-alanyl-D-alanine carboxypeptidase [Spirilliplanes yamanashiensis]GIJ03045.1 serine hydrolase [Spirilliplanes yamanashiensis]
MTTKPKNRRRMLPLAAGALAALTAGAALTAPAAFADSRPGRADTVQQRLDALVERDGFPGALASVRGAGGRVRDYTAGVGDLATGRAVPRDGQVRIGSNTKPFTAVVVLQLVGEGRIGLDETVERYLPGLVRGEGIDGRKITVRQLLQQTSGLPDYDDVLFTQAQDLVDKAGSYYDPRRLVDAALTRPAVFAPGEKWGYSNTNYVLAGLVVERVTERPVGEEITRRIIEPLGLRDTYWPGVGDQRIAGRHPRGYVALEPGAPWIDVTRMDPSLGWAAGQLIGSPGDLRRFFEALLAGKLLKPAQQAALTQTVAAPGFEPTEGWEYGLGVARHTLSCGGHAWGHGGDIQGFETRNLATEDGRSAVVAVTALPTSLEMTSHVSEAVDAALCAGR